MLNNLFALIVFMHNPDQWKADVYEIKYEQVIYNNRQKAAESSASAQRQNNNDPTLRRISWYAKGLKDPQAYTAACWATYPKGSIFRISYNGASVDVVCTDRGHFQEMGRFLDLSKGAFEQLAPLSKGIINAKVEQIK